MNYLKVSLGIFVALAASRFIPHPPNFTSLLALGFYIPAFFGKRYIPALVLGFAVTDLFIGFHSLTIFTWGSLFFIGFLPQYFMKGITSRISGSLLGACIFFVITNFGVWSLGTYEYSINGFILCYTLAIPFFFYSLISTFLFSTIIETIYKFRKIIYSYVRINKHYVKK